MTAHRYTVVRQRGRKQDLEYRGFTVAEDSYRRKTCWLVINPLRRGVGFFEGPRSKQSALDWIDRIYVQGKAEEMLQRPPKPGVGGLLPDEPHPNRERFLQKASVWGEMKEIVERASRSRECSYDVLVELGGSSPAFDQAVALKLIKVNTKNGDLEITDRGRQFVKP